MDDQEVDPEHVAGVDRLHEERTGPLERGRVPGGDVPDVGEVRHAGPQPAPLERLAEALDVGLTVPGTRPGSRVRDEDLQAVGASERSFLDRPCDATACDPSLPAPDVGAQDHA
jgi:hypothetical protein